MQLNVSFQRGLRASPFSNYAARHVLHGEEDGDVCIALHQQQALSGCALVRHGAWMIGSLGRTGRPAFSVWREDKLIVFERQADYRDGAGSVAQKILPRTKRIVLIPLKYKGYEPPLGLLHY